MAKKTFPSDILGNRLTTNDVMGKVEGVTSASDKAISSAQEASKVNGRDPESETAAVAAGLNACQAVIALANVLRDTGLLGAGGAALSAIVDINNNLKSIEDLNKNTDLEPDQRILESLRLAADTVGAMGSLLSLTPFPHAKALGFALSLAMTGVKRALEAAKNKDFEQAKREQQNARDALNRGAGFSDEVDDLFRGVRVHPSPLVLDLDGNGFDIKLLSAYGPRFDQDGDGRYSRTAWVEATDGLLALDLNGNGMIDSGVELFGNNFLLPSGQRARWL